jgi:hypothetical protein
MRIKTASKEIRFIAATNHFTARAKFEPRNADKPVSACADHEIVAVIREGEREMSVTALDVKYASLGRALASAAGKRLPRWAR